MSSILFAFDRAGPVRGRLAAGQWGSARRVRVVPLFRTYIVHRPYVAYTWLVKTLRPPPAVGEDAQIVFRNCAQYEPSSGGAKIGISCRDTRARAQTPTRTHHPWQLGFFYSLSLSQI